MKITGTKLLFFNFLFFFLSIVIALLRYNAHTIQVIDTVYNSMAFSIFTESYVHQHHQFWNIFTTLKRNLVLLTPNTALPLTPAQETTSLPSVSIDLPILDISHKQSHTIHGPL